MNEFPSNVQRVAIAGDWHANTKYAQKAIHWAGKQGAQVVLHVGDFGFNFTDGFLNTLDFEAERAGLILMFVDGNHENFDWLLAQPVDEDGVRRLRTNVWHLPRGFRWEWLSVRFLALGGAHSVDRQWRTPGVEWWPQETIKLNEFYEVMSSGYADVMITHDCPDKVDVPGLLDGVFPAEEIHSADLHREGLGYVVDEVQPDWLFHGHYHRRYDVVRPGLFTDTRIVGLDCDGTDFDKNMIVMNVEDLK